MKKSHPQKKKFAWNDGYGRNLTAGGILIYDDTGVWLIKEKRNGSMVWTDPGGKYRFEDCDIYAAIAREFCEELYNSSSITRKNIVNIASSHLPVYVNGHQQRPVYICYIVHIEELKCFDVDLSPTKFLIHRDKTLISNPTVPEDYYNSIELKHVSFRDISEVLSGQNKEMILSYRLQKILRCGSLAIYL